MCQSASIPSTPSPRRRCRPHPGVDASQARLRAPTIPGQLRGGLMDVFGLRERLVDDYEEYTRSFIAVRDERVAETVDAELERGLLWPDPLVQLNPSFASGGTIDDLIAEGTLHADMRPGIPCRQGRGRGRCRPAARRCGCTSTRPRPSAPRVGRELRPDDRHGLGQEPHLHHPHRRPRPARGLRQGHQGHRRLPHERSGQQPGRRAGEVPASTGSPTTSVPSLSPATPARRTTRSARRSSPSRPTSCSRTT